MYCSNCGSKNEGNKFCVNCGNKLNNINGDISDKKENCGLKTASIVLGILSIIGSFMVIFSPFCFILSLVGLILGTVVNKKVRNIIGIVLNSIGLFLSIAMILIIMLLIRFAINSYNDNNYDEYYDSFYDDDFGKIDEYFNNFFNNEGYNDNEYNSDYYEKFKDIISIY